MFDADPIDPGILEASQQAGCAHGVNHSASVTATVNPNDARGDGADAPKPAANWNDIRHFMAALLPWPGENPGYVNLHYAMIGSDGKLITGAGWPYKTIEPFLRRAAWLNTASNFKGVWFCTSSQRSAGTNTKGKPKAIRLHKNVLQVKALWVDVDVKPDDATGQHYTTLKEAWDAMAAFRTKVGLPQFSAAVNSGGGLHIYWISDKPLDPSEWAPYAQGLKALLLQEHIKCDAGLTTDDVRLLRMPGTFNHKYDPPREVELLRLPLTRYDFATSLGFLTTPVTVAVNPDVLYSPFFEGVDPAGFGKAVFTIEEGSTLGDSAETCREYGPLDPRPVFEQCSFMKEARVTGGRDFNEPLWNLSVLASTFLENGRPIAHEISRDHPGYSPADTDAKYDQKEAAKAVGGVGWPSCATIHGTGCKSCASCPHFANGKTPLHLTGPVTATVSPDPTMASLSIWSPASLRANFANIRHRRMLYGHDLVRGENTVLGSPGGVGKSSLAIGMAVSIATDKELLDEKIRGNHLKVLLINAEDSADEIRRRVWAFCLAHSVGEHELDRLYVAGADDCRVQRLSFLRTNQKGYSELDTAGLAELRSALQSLSPDVIILDPLVALCAQGNMNDNPSMSLVMRALKGLATEFDCAILIVHHTRKNAEAGAADAISGAASIVNLARRAIMPVTPSAEEAAALGILPSERLRHFKLIDAKSNLVPRSTDLPLYCLQGVELPNAEPPTYPFGDNVQAVVRIQPLSQAANARSMDEQKIRQTIVDLVKRGKVIDGKAYPYSPSPAGANNIRGLLEDAIPAAKATTAPRQWAPGDLEAIVAETIKKLLKDNTLMSFEITEAGRFRRRQGLQLNPSLIPNGDNDGANDDAVT